MALPHGACILQPWGSLQLLLPLRLETGPGGTAGQESAVTEPHLARCLPISSSNRKVAPYYSHSEEALPLHLQGALQSQGTSARRRGLASAGEPVIQTRVFVPSSQKRLGPAPSFVAVGSDGRTLMASRELVSITDLTGKHLPPPHAPPTGQA